jgi:dynein heavy chain
LEDGCYFLRKNLPEPVKTVDNNITQSIQRILDCYFAPYIETEIKKIQKEEI